MCAEHNFVANSLLFGLRRGSGAASSIPMSNNPFDDPGSSEPLDDAVLQDVDAIMAARSLDDLMKTEDAEALRSILAALHEFPELDGFIANFCAEFREWSPEAEQPLRWMHMHKDFVRLVEQRIEQHLQAHGATSADLHALLAETTGGDARADRFLAIVLGLEDYGQFCGLMQAHAASLAVAAEMESVALS